MRVEIRPRTAVALLFAVLLVTVTGSMVGAEISDGTDSEEFQTETLADGSELYLYTSSGESTAQRTLALNLLVYGDAETTEDLLRQQSTGEWEELDEDEADVGHDEDSILNDSSTAWGSADGSVRYTYIDPPGEDGRWVDESYQLKDGAYLGERHHIRAYTDPADDNWTAMQAHWEHWDWFELRHSVHSIEESQSYVEAEFFDRWYVDSLSREWMGNDRSSDSDGWMTVVEIDERATVLLSLVLVGSFGVRALTRRTEVTNWWEDDGVQATVRALLVIAAIVAVYTVVRVGGVQAELLFSETNPKLIVAAFYPLLICGLPIVTYLSARHLDVLPAFTAAAIGFVVATFLDLGGLGVTSLALQTIIHRISLAVALGFIAAGASQTARSPVASFGHVRTGVLLWLVAVGVPLLRHVPL
ncbi:hypothetical protein OB905_11130 [Halobacteria archaeon AArc-dxtr1]|nr:hypothetical protein [Halobacteria archaeon AArc-dxtr1]